MKKRACHQHDGSLLLSAGSAHAASADPYIERETQALLTALNRGGSQPIEQLSPAEARKMLAELQASVDVDMSGVVISHKTINVDGHPLALTIVRPDNAGDMPPAFMFFHGGGWVLGDFPAHQRMVRDLVRSSGAAAVFVDYTLSPEAHYPVAIHQAYAATLWVSEHGAEINVDGQRLAVVGNSAGGNMATVVCLMAKEKGSPTLRYQVLFCPVTDARFDTESYQRFAEGRFLTRAMMTWFWDHYTTRDAERAEIYASPLRASEAQLKGLPPALIQTAENDVLRDEGEAYARHLNAAGVDVVQVRYNGMIHDFGFHNALVKVPEAQAALDQAGRLLKKHLR
ncbi:alpha/beta hydrolase [Lonsdalea britannica]|uniref:Alpha/beta hydrolase n=1 Tax=Lonsdalea britannica TaxID=1082704 RepID=A0AAD0WJE1_9GAMM|nr:alpha/beta hydrolase [Lonsdalea britannica]AXW85776.1 alpha/beta hydrolase [Lonsdalea britannica]OSM95492.1 alpha/beta hydrolase [Lonsdalea britannica]